MSYEALADEATSRPFEGWDFSWLRKRAPITKALPWRYPEVVSKAASGTQRMLDMGTGGGEALLRIRGRAATTIADEAYPPNVPVAAATLRPHGILVVQVEGTPDNDRQHDALGRMPYRSQVFDCVANRHESFLASEVFRILKSGGSFVTQQVDLHTYDDFYAVFGLDLPPQAESWLPLALEQLRQAGFEIIEGRRGEEHQSFRDIAALIWYLRAVSWALSGFDVSHHEAALRRIHAELDKGPLVIRQRRFLVVARRP